MLLFKHYLFGKTGLVRRYYQRRVFTKTIQKHKQTKTLITRRLFRIKNKNRSIYTNIHFIKRIASARRPISNFERCEYVKRVSPQSWEEPGENEDITEELTEDMNLVFPEPTPEEQLSIFGKFKRAFLRQFGGVIPYVSKARTIGISALESAISVFKQIFEILSPLATGSFSNILKLLKNLIQQFTEPIMAFVQQQLSNYLSIGATAAYVVMAVMLTLAAALPSEQISTYMRFVLAAFGLLVGYFRNLYGAAFGATMSYIVLKFSKQATVRVEVTNPIRLEPQADIDDYISTSKTKEDFKQLACQLLSCLSLCTLASAGLKMPTDPKSIDDMLRRHAVLGRAHQTWELIIDKFGDLVETSLQIVSKYLYKQEYIPKNKVQEVEELYREVMILCTLRGNQQVGRDPGTALKVEALYIQMMLLRRTYRENRKVMQVLDEVSGPLLAMYKRVLEKNPHAHTMRKEPVCIVFHGKTGVGKSYLMAQLQIDLLKIVDKFDPTKSLEALVYSRCFEQEYWDGFMGQPIVIFDDFAQAVDSVTNPNIEFFELIRTINIFPYQPHCAAIGDKANNPFTADFVVLTTNVKELQAKSLYSNDAIKRRIHLNYEVSLREEVTEKYWSDLHPVMAKNPFLYRSENEEHTEQYLHINYPPIQKHVPHTQSHRLNADALRFYREVNGLPSTDISHYAFSDGLKVMTYVEMLSEIADQTRKHQESFDQRQEIANTVKDLPLPQKVWSKGSRWTPQAEDTHVGRVEHEYKMSLKLFLKQTPKMRVQLAQAGILIMQYCKDDYHPIQFKTLAEFKVWAREEHYNPDTGLELPGELRAKLLLASSKRDKRVFAEFAQYHFGIDKYAGISEYTQDISFYKKCYLNLWKRFEIFQKNVHGSLIEQDNPERFGEVNWFNVKRYLLIAGFVATSLFTGYQMYMCSGVWSSKTIVNQPLFSIFLRYIQLTGVANFCSILGIPQLATYALTTGLFYGVLIKDALAHTTYHDIHKNQSDTCVKCLGFAKWKQNIYGSEMWNEYVRQMEAGKLEKLQPSDDEIRAALLERQEENQEGQQLEHGSAPRAEMIKVAQDLEHGSAARPEITERKTTLEMDPDIQKLFKINPESGRSGPTTESRSQELQGFFSEQTSALVDKVRGNQWQFCIGNTEAYLTIGHIFMLKGHVGVINHHFLEKASLYIDQNPNADLVLFRKPNQPPSHMVQLKVFLSTIKRITRGQVLTEFYTFRAPTTMPHAGDMSKHLVTASDIGKLSRGTRVMLATFQKTPSGQYERTIREGSFVETFVAELPSLNDPTKFHHYPETLRYMMSSLKGDCGSPLFICNDQFVRKLVGFHIAGEPGFGSSSVITINDVASCLRNECSLAEPKLVQPQNAPDFPLVGSFEYIGIATPPANQPLKTKIQRSMIHGMIGTVETAPAAMAPALKPDGPMLKALSKYANPSPLLDESIIAHAVKDYEDLINTYPPLEVEKRVLTDDEAVEGISGNEFFPSVKRTKSAGWPHSYLVRGKGKIPWLGTGAGDKPPLYAKLMEELHEMEDQCRKGIIPETYFVDTLKDEKRPIEKVQAGKTRVFSASSLPFTLLCRKYFAGFLAFMMRTKIGNECAVGVNAVGKDWEKIVHHLKRFGEKSLIGADFANFDGTINFYIFVQIVDIINRFYNDGAQNARVRKMIWECICKSAHILGPFAYRLNHGQPSGNPTTAITNSVYNSLSVRYCFYYRFLIELAWKNAPMFRRVIRMLAYGDDQLIAVSKTIQEHFNPIILSRLYAMIGMTYTSEDKGSQTSLFRDFNEVTFLKRAFDYDPNLHHWFAPLDIRSIRESCNWVRKSTSIENATLENVEDALVELYQHSERTFEEYSDKFKQAISRVSEYRITHYDWDFARRLIAADRGSELHSTERAWV